MQVPRPHISNFQGIRRFRRSHYRTDLFRLGGLFHGYRVTMLMLMTVGCLCGTPTWADVDLEACVGGWLEARTWVNDMAIPNTPTEAADIPGLRLSASSCDIVDGPLDLAWPMPNKNSKEVRRSR